MSQRSFAEWARAYRGRNLHIIDLVGDVADDGRWPNPPTLPEARSYLRSRRACEAALKALTRAWRLYAASLNRRRAA